MPIKKKDKSQDMLDYEALCDIWQEANAVDTVVGRPDVLMQKIAKLRDDFGSRKPTSRKDWEAGYERCRQDMLADAYHADNFAPASKEAGKVEAVADERQPSDGDYLRCAEQAGAKVNWDFESASSARVVFLTASQWGRFCDKVRALYLRPSQQALSDDRVRKIADECGMFDADYEETPGGHCDRFARAILAAAGGKE